MSRFLLLMLLLGVAAIPAGRAAVADPHVLSWLLPTQPVKIVGPIHYVGTRGLGVYLIVTPRGHILLYGGMPCSASLIERNIRALGFDPKRIRWILTCHAHVDHVGTHAWFKELSHAKVAIMRQEFGLLKSGGKTDFHYHDLPLAHFPRVHADCILKDGQPFRFGGIQMTPILTPGHTRGGTTWVMTVREAGRSYRVVFPDGTSINPGYRLLPPESYPGIAADYALTFRRLDQLHPDIWLHGHAFFFDFHGKRRRAEKLGVKAWVDPEGYRRFLQKGVEVYNQQLAREQKALVRRKAKVPPVKPVCLGEACRRN